MIMATKRHVNMGYLVVLIMNIRYHELNQVPVSTLGTNDKAMLKQRACRYGSTTKVVR